MAEDLAAVLAGEAEADSAAAAVVAAEGGENHETDIKHKIYICWRFDDR